MTKRKLFDIIVDTDKLNSSFNELNLRINRSAKQLIELIFSDYQDLDGNFIEQFQTTGFNPRLWELYIFKVILETKSKIVYDYPMPDFHAVNESGEFYIEAVTSNPAQDDTAMENVIAEMENSTNPEVSRKNSKLLVQHYFRKISSSLNKKLNEKYWERDWVTGKPLVFAITPIHSKYANFFPDYNLFSFLYGKQVSKLKHDNGKEEAVLTEITEHFFDLKGNSIPSGFFSFQNAENVSAVMFSNNCDVNKFHRMALEGLFPDPEIFLYRSGLQYSHNSDIARPFNYLVRDGSNRENWLEGISIFHNPNANNPLDVNVFKGTRQIWLEDGKLKEIIPEFYPFNSINMKMMLSV